MFQLNYVIESAVAQLFAAVPELVLKLRITSSAAAATIHNVLSQSQKQIESTRRRYTAALNSLFDSADAQKLIGTCRQKEVAL